jgi:hypothetical protein
MAPLTKALKKGLNDLQAATMWLMQNAMQKPDNAGAASTDYMHLMGLVSLGYMWGLMADVARTRIAEGGSDTGFHEAKLATARFYMERVMPETSAHLARISSGKGEFDMAGLLHPAMLSQRVSPFERTFHRVMRPGPALSRVQDRPSASSHRERNGCLPRSRRT